MLCIFAYFEAGMRLADSIRAESDALHMLAVRMALHMLTMLYLCLLCFTYEAGMRLADSIRAESDALHMLALLILCI